jgi:small GTP-binding protein
MSHSQLFLSSCHEKRIPIDFCEFHNKQRLCMKKKVLMLGLDGVGKTDLFTRLISYQKQSTRTNQPTIGEFYQGVFAEQGFFFILGYNVETIKVYCNHLWHRRSHKITLWDCGGQSSLRPLWSYYFPNTSLLLWIINVHDRSRLETNLQLLSQILTNPLLYRVPVLIVLYDSLFGLEDEQISEEDNHQNLLTNLEVAFRFLATFSISRSSTFKWQVININSNDDDLKKIRQSFKELMDL